ncbi:MAG: TerB family tellurite resistance protein [Bacteroidaceae bacterium]|nr:TerB family tellurite resistance protein [Bacteroidaceae bacterium]MBR1793661.1 TerB family tellurite resistance protein [Bacteroidales bacterium]
MTFNKVEMTAIMSMVHAMIVADGKVADEEISVISAEMIKFGIPLTDFKELFLKGRDMEPSIAVEIVSKMTYEQKKYVAAYLGNIMAVDNDIDGREIALWKLLSQLCNLPSMTVAEAIKYMRE